MTKAENLRALSDEELHLKHQDLKREIFEMRSQMMLKKDNASVQGIRERKKDIARILTICAERSHKISQGLGV